MQLRRVFIHTTMHSPISPIYDFMLVVESKRQPTNAPYVAFFNSYRARSVLTRLIASTFFCPAVEQTQWGRSLPPVVRRRKQPSKG